MFRRLLLSYLIVVGLTVALLGGTVRWVTARTFTRYLTDQASVHSRMLPAMLATHYARYDGWQGAQAIIDQAVPLIGAPVDLADATGRIVAATEPGRVGGKLVEEGAALKLPVLGPDGRSLGTVYVGRTLDQQRADAAFLAAVSRGLVLAGLTVALLAAVAGWLLARSISRPLAEMHRAAARVAGGDYAVRVSDRGPEEIGALGRAFNRMAEGMAGVEAMRRRLVADVSHELRTPLTVLRGYLEGLRSGRIADRQSAEQAFSAMEAETGNLLRLVDDLRNLAALDAGAGALDLALVQPGWLVQRALQRVAPLAEAKAVQLAAELPDTLPLVVGDEERLGQVLFNLLDNAIRHTPADGSVTVAASSDGPILTLTVRDTGAGIAPEHLPYVFERFFRADAARSRGDSPGTGIGLAIVRATVEAHGGTVRVKSTPGQGSAFSVHLPVRGPDGGL